MPSGTYPTYAYRPPLPGTPPKIRKCSSLRGRLFSGGTYFRSTEPGRSANNITVGVIEESGNGYAVIQNKNIVYAENVIGNCVTKILNFTGSYTDLFVIDQLDTSPRIRKYSISLRIAFERQQSQPYVLPTLVELGSFVFDKLFSTDKLSVLLSKTAVPFTSSDAIFITSRARIYQLSSITVTPPPDPVTMVQGPSVTGWDIDNLRSQVTASDPWIQMLPRSGDTPGSAGPPPTPSVPATTVYDVQDSGVDDLVMVSFADSNLVGGDGLPDNPSIEVTGPTRSLVLVNYGEQPNGALGEYNKMYEWVGDTAIAGSWSQY